MRVNCEYECVFYNEYCINTLNAELNPIRHLIALVGARHILHVSKVRVKSRITKYFDWEKIGFYV